jgi:hypothetical protein
MSYRFFRRLRIAPGLTVNLSKSGPSLSVGARGGHVTLGGSRGRRTTIGLAGDRALLDDGPPPGILKKSRLGRRGADRLSSASQRDIEGRAEADAVLLPSAGDSGRRAGLRRRLPGAGRWRPRRGAGPPPRGHPPRRWRVHGRLSRTPGRGVRGSNGDLEAAVAVSDELGRTVDRFGIAATLVLHITDEIAASLEPSLEGALLAPVEAFQRVGRAADALTALRRLQALAPDDPVVRLSLAELLVHGQPAERPALEEAARLGENVPNDSAIHAALRLYRATAMRELGLPDAATAVLSETLRRTADRPVELLHALRYERALAYEAAGQPKRARNDLERLYAEAPDYEDVARRLGMPR